MNMEKMYFKTFLASLVFLIFLSGNVLGQVTWVGVAGGGDGSSWSDPLNWDTGAIPTISDAVTVVNTGTGNFGLNILTDAQAASLTMTNNSPFPFVSMTMIIGFSCESN